MGLTGKVIEKGGPMIFMDGEDDLAFCLEVDNVTQILDYENALMCPLVDDKGRLKGVVQLINKLNGEQISEQDGEEIMSICSALAEILNLCDMSKEVTNLSASLSRVL